MKARHMIAALAAAVLIVSASLHAADEKKDPLAGLKCPISDKPVVAASATDYKGGQIYFCCKNCPKAFSKKTAKYSAKANAQLVATGQAKQKACPISGKSKLNPETKIKVNGIAVSFCCNGCKGKVKKAKGDAQINLVFSDKAFDKGFKVEKKKS